VERKGVRGGGVMHGGGREWQSIARLRERVGWILV